MNDKCSATSIFIYLKGLYDSLLPCFVPYSPVHLIVKKKKYTHDTHTHTFGDGGGRLAIPLPRGRELGGFESD